MVAINLTTVLFELMPALLVTLAYLIILKGRRNRFIEAFIILMYVKFATSFLFYTWFLSEEQAANFNPYMPPNYLSWFFILEFIFQFAYSLQEFLTWVMVSFFAVLFGMLVLAVKMAFQDPLKMKFKNLITRLVGREPVSDGYSGFRDRLAHLTFEEVPENPMDPEVMKKAWSSSWKDYLIIGLATLLPSIPAYMGSLDGYIRSMTGDPTYVPPSAYILGILVFLTWIYRFGYPASNRIAKGAGLKLGDRDVGDEMMQGVLGWFFRLNILLTIIFLTFDILRTTAAGTFHFMIDYYLLGAYQAFPPILFAIIVLPLVERFSVVLYKKTFDSLLRAGTKIRQMDWRKSLTTFFSAIAVGLLISAAFIGAVFAVTLFTADALDLEFAFLPGQIHYTIRFYLLEPANNMITLIPSLWILLILLLPMAAMILAGIISHYVKDALGCGMEGFAFFSGLVASVGSYFLLPGLDYLVGRVPTAVNCGGLFFYHLRPTLIIPGNTPEEILYRLASQFAVNVPIFISAVLFIMYYFEYKERWREETGVESGPLLNVHLVDVTDAVLMFLGGVIVSAIAVYLLSYFIDLGELGFLIENLIFEIGLPDGLELVLATNVSSFLIIFEHNTIRTLLMMVAGPIFWSLVLSLVDGQKSASGKRKVLLSTLLIAILGIIGSFIWLWLDIANGVVYPSMSIDDPYWPWTYSALLGLRAAIILGILFVAFSAVAVVKKLTSGALAYWWFPPLLALFALEYFIYDDQFTLISLIVLPMILTGFYKIVYGNRDEVKNEDPLITYIRLSLMSLAIAEILSTALWLAGIGIIGFLNGQFTNFVVSVFPHGIIEIPTFLLVAAVSLRIARDLEPVIRREDWDEVPRKTSGLLLDGRLWRTYLIVLFLLLISALVEAYVTPILIARF